MRALRTKAFIYINETDNNNKCLKLCLLIKVNILVYQHARCDCKLWNIPWLFYVFVNFHTLLVTIQVWIVVYLPNFHRLWVWFVPAMWYVDNAKLSDSNEFFFENFQILNITLYVWNVISLSNYHIYCVYGNWIHL